MLHTHQRVDTINTTCYCEHPLSEQEPGWLMVVIWSVESALVEGYFTMITLV